MVQNLNYTTDEKILVRSKRYNVGRGLLIVFIIATILATLYFVGEYMENLEWKQRAWDACGLYHSKFCIHKYYSSPASAALDVTKGALSLAGTIIGSVGLICLLIYAWMRSYEIIVTDKRVYGRAAFGKRVDLPMDSVSAIGSGWPKGIAVATSSGKIAFLMIKNSEEIHTAISQLLLERQNMKSSKPVEKEIIPQTNADELKKYKELLDMGVITQEEFDAKKKQLLGL